MFPSILTNACSPTTPLCIRVEPLYYTHGIIRWNNEDPYPPLSKAPHVKSLTVLTGTITASLHNYLPHCHSLEELTLWEHTNAVTPETVPILESLFKSPLRRSPWTGFHTLTASLRALFRHHLIQDKNGNMHIDFTNPIIKGLRHLRLLRDTEWIKPSSWVEGNSFGCLAFLRYVQFDEIVCAEVVVNILRECENLELIVFGVTRSGWQDVLPRTRPVKKRRSWFGPGGDVGSRDGEDEDVGGGGHEPEHRVVMVPRNQTWGYCTWHWNSLATNILEKRRSGKVKRVERRRARNLRERGCGLEMLDEFEDCGLNLMYGI
ncbi:hypothetical protein AX16_005428 [Volvariella volvacea WC 439]|nr:hypothetical protein AX16_005428 [Volvariella volvacea WC 439]